MSNYVLFGLGGVGDITLALSCASYVQDCGYYTEVIACARKEVFEPLEILFGNLFNLYRHEAGENIGENYKLITDNTILESYKKNYNGVYVVCPDLLFRAEKYSFNYSLFKTHPQTIRQKRLLENQWKPTNLVYLSLNTSTDAYHYCDPVRLAYRLAEEMPSVTFYYPVLSQWAGKNLPPRVIENAPRNLIIDRDPSWTSALSFLIQSCYCVTLDNGIMHLAYHLGMPRLILDPYFSDNPGILWRVRWRQNDLFESIPLNSHIKNVVDTVRINLEIPQSCLMPRYLVSQNSLCDFSQVLGFKF